MAAIQFSDSGDIFRDAQRQGEAEDDLIEPYPEIEDPEDVAKIVKDKHGEYHMVFLRKNLKEGELQDLLPKNSTGPVRLSDFPASFETRYGYKLSKEFWDTLREAFIELVDEKLVD